MPNQSIALQATDYTDAAHCSKCGKLRPISELNGYDPLASTPIEKYEYAYCRRLVDCSGDDAQAAIDELLQALSC